MQLFGFVSFALPLVPACSCGRQGLEAEEEGKKTGNYDLNGFERFSGTLGFLRRGAKSKTRGERRRKSIVELLHKWRDVPFQLGVWPLAILL